MAMEELLSQEETEAGKRIYREKYQSNYESTHSGKFVAIDLSTEKAYIGNSPDEVFEAARKEASQGKFYVTRVGLPSVRVSSPPSAATVNSSTKSDTSGNK